MEKLAEEVNALGVTVKPVEIIERECPKIFGKFNYPEKLDEEITQNVEIVLGIMQNNNLLQFPDRKAVWFSQKIYLWEKNINTTKKRIGTTFPVSPPNFEVKCERLSEEKVERTIDSGLVCSYENRDPKNEKFGGSARFVFRLIPRSHEVKEVIFTIIGAPSGEREYEDMALYLGALYLSDLILLGDEQTQEILRRADASVKDDPDFRPKDSSITDYVENLFNLIDEEGD